MKRKVSYIMLMIGLMSAINLNLNEEEPPLFGTSIVIEVKHSQSQKTNTEIKLLNEEEPPLFG
jgi:hypothetical protein